MDGGADAETMNKGLQKFRKTLIQLKRPYIEQLEEYDENAGSMGTIDSEDPLSGVELQHLDRIQRVLYTFNKLYEIIEYILQTANTSNALQTADLDSGAVIQLFEKNGVLETVRTFPSLAEDMRKYLRIELKLYPFTLNTKLVNSFLKYDVEPHIDDGKIVPNE